MSLPNYAGSVELAKHSRVSHSVVRLNGSSSELHLTISDDGAGFGAELAMKKGGSGLISMRERVRLVGGTIAIDSKSMGGTPSMFVCLLIRSRFPRAQQDRK